MAALSVQRSSGGRIRGEALLGGDFGERRAQALIGGNAAGNDERLLRVVPERIGIKLHGAPRAVADDIGRCLLEARAKIGDVLIAERRPLHRLVPERGLQSREREMRLRPPVHRARQSDGCAAALGGLLDRRTAGIVEAEQLRRLVESLAKRIVQGRAEARVLADVLDDEQLRVSARDEQQQIRKAQAMGEARVSACAFEMVHGDEGQPARKGDGLAGGDADDQPADQPRPRRGGDAVDLVEAETPASVSASAIRTSSSSTWARAAISGTTPPNSACSASCERTTLARMTPLPSASRRTSAAAVSSQLVSMPSTTRSRGFGAVAMMLLYRVSRGD